MLFQIIGNYKLQNIQAFAAGVQIAMAYECKKDEHGRESWVFVGRVKRRKSQSWETAIDESINGIEQDHAAS